MTDLRKTIKISLKSILKKNVTYDKFFDVIHRSNDIIFICYTFITSYVLHLFKNKIKIPNIDKDFIRMSFKAISKSSVGPKPTGMKSDILKKLNTFYKDEFVYVIANQSKNININEDQLEFHKFNASNLSYAINHFEIEMETMITNNIQMRFVQYVHMYTKQHFLSKKVKKLPKEKYNLLSAAQKLDYKTKLSEQYEQNKIISKELHYVINDLFDDTKTSDQKYHKWVKKNKKIIFPKIEHMSFSYEDDISVNCFKYLENMLRMNAVLEKNNSKLFSVLPLRTQLTDKYVTVNTSLLKDVFGEVTSKLSNEEIWKKYFDINLKKIKIKDYSFNFQISTDSYAVSINFIKNDQIEKKAQKSKAMNEGSKATKSLLKGKTGEDYKAIMKEIDKKKKEKKIETVKKIKEIKKEQKEKFLKLPKNEQDEIKLKLKLIKNKFEYIEDAVKNDQLRIQLKDADNEHKLKFIDPGSRAPMSILGQGKLRENKTGKNRRGLVLYSYSSGTRLKGLKRIKYMKLIKNKKNKTLINNTSLTTLENNLSIHNSKTVDYDKFINYAKEKLLLRKELSMSNNLKNLEEIAKKNTYVQLGNVMNEKYKNGKVFDITKNDQCIINEHLLNNKKKIEIKSALDYNKYVQKLKWFGYINKQRHEDKLLNDIEDVYGKDAIFIFGDWSAKGRIRKISMPNMGMKKLLEKRFKVYLINEYNTSKLGWKMKEKNENIKIKQEYEINGVLYKTVKEIHSVFTSKMCQKSHGLINRDYNALLNMKKITKSLLETKKRPIEFIHKIIKHVKEEQKKKINNKKAGTVIKKADKACKNAIVI